MKKFCILVLLSLVYPCLGQDASTKSNISGKVVESEDQSKGMPNLVVKLIGPSFERMTKSADDGSFTFENVGTGNYTVVISEIGYFESSTDIDYVFGESKTMDPISIERNMTNNVNQNDIPTVDQGDDESSNLSNNTVASLLNSSRDIFAFNAFMSLGQGGFRPRGQNGQDQVTMINGIPMENIVRGNQQNFNDYVGLNDVLRGRNNYYGIKAIPFAFGELTNNVDIDAEAINQRKGLRLSQWITNRNFTSRTALTYSSGLLKNNFAFSGSVSFRGASEGYIPGTAMETLSAYLSISKKWSQKFTSSLTGFMSDNKRAVSSAATREYYDLAGTNYYNPNWGMFQGVKRSANIRRDNVPSIILSNEWKPSQATQINFSFAGQMGSRYVERLDWYNANNPFPNYYRKAPSYLTDSSQASDLAATLRANPSLLQMDWNTLYLTNYLVNDSVPTKPDKGRWSRYVMYKDMQDVNMFTGNMIVRHQVNEKLGLFGGFMAQTNTTEFYRELSDLLGGQFYVNIDYFAGLNNPSKPNAIHNNLDKPYQVVKVGDKYGTHYKATASNISGWMQGLLTLDKVDGFGALKIEQSSYQRQGLVRNGVFDSSSFGNSATASFTNLSFKGGMTYKLNGKNYISLNALYLSNSPTFEQVFAVPNVSNRIAKNVGSMTTTMGELTYNYRGSRVKGYFSSYYTVTNGETDFNYLYSEITQSFGKIIVADISRRYAGIEAAVEAKLGNSGFTALGLASIGDFINTNRPNYSFYYEDLDSVTPAQTVYWKDMYLPNGPQLALTSKLTYNSKQFWTASIAFNYWDKNYTDISAERRTTEAVKGVDPSSPLYSKILRQEILPAAFTVDLFFRKSFMINKYVKSLKKRMYFDLNVSLNNIFDNTKVVTTGFEQQRFDLTQRNPDRFPNRYFFMMGRTYSVNFVFRM